LKTQSIQFRIISAIVLILLVSVILSIILTTTNQRNNLLDSTRKTLSINTQMLNLTIRNIMLSGEAPIANRTIDDLRGIAEFTEFSLYRSDGTAAFNDYSTLNFVNSYQMDFMFDETPRSDRSVMDDPAFRQVLQFRTPVINLDQDSREMEYFFPILNYAECRVCHGEESFVRGVSHFRISLEEIYTRVFNAGVFLSLFFSSVGILIFIWLLVMLRQIIIRPVLSIGEVVNVAATGDLDVQVELERSDELGELGSRINHMIAGLKERNELQIQNRVIETRLEENRKYLDNINEGLLMLNPAGRITEQFSTYLMGMFENNNPAGMDFRDFLYPDAHRFGDQREDLSQFLDVLFKNTTADMDMIMSINPLDEAVIRISRGREMIVHADFQRIRRGDEIENVMVIFEDLTDIVRTRQELEEERRQRESEVAQIAAILKVGPAVFEGFIEEAWAAFRELQNCIGRLEDRDTLARLFREIHSVKGTARYLDYHRIEELAHQIEDILSEIRDSRRPPDTSVRKIISRLLEDLFAQMEGVEALIERFREFSSVKGAEPGEQSPILTVFEDRVSRMVEKLSGDLGKEVSFLMDNQVMAVPELPAVQASLFHLLRNALDHGLEDPMERLAAGKEGEARLVLRFRRNEEHGLVIEVEDDGRGIDLADVERRGVEKGLLKPGEHFPSQIIRVLFMPGFSSRDAADTISGRGVGLDAVRDNLKKLNGKISVRTAVGKGTRFTLILPAESEEDV